MITSCWRSGGFLVCLTRPPPVALPVDRCTDGFEGARKFSAAPPVMSRTRLPPPVMSWAVAAHPSCNRASARTKQKDFLIRNPTPWLQFTTHSGGIASLLAPFIHRLRRLETSGALAPASPPRCEAGLCPAGDPQTYSLGLCPWSGLCPYSPRARGRTGGLSPIFLVRLPAGQSPASHRGG